MNSTNNTRVYATYDGSGWKELDKITYDLETYYLWVILCFGFPGNCCTIVTILKLSPPRSLTVYIALLAVVDNLAILTKLLMFVLTDNGVQIGRTGCTILGFSGNFLSTYSNWLLVSLSVERFAAVWFPFEVGKMWTFKKSLAVVAFITIPLVALFLHLFWTMDYDYIPEDGSVFCKINEDHLYFMVFVWYWINVIVYAILPCLLLLIFNLVIVAGILKSRKSKLLNKSNSIKEGHTPADRQRHITVMLVTSALALVIMTTPRCVMLILSRYLNPSNKSMEGAVLYLVDTLAYILCDSTHAINFYLYSFSSRRFRLEFCGLFTCCLRQAPASPEYMSLSSRPSQNGPKTFTETRSTTWKRQSRNS